MLFFLLAMLMNKDIIINPQLFQIRLTNSLSWFWWLVSWLTRIGCLDPMSVLCLNYKNSFFGSYESSPVDDAYASPTGEYGAWLTRMGCLDWVPESWKP